MQKLKYDTFEKHESPFDTRDAIKECVEINTIQAAQSKNIFKIRVDDSVPETVIVDKERVTQIFQNILQKALQVTDRGKTITIKASVSPNPTNDQEARLNFNVGLIGELISVEQLAELFSAKDKDKIGFLVAQRLCRKLGGEFWVTCENN